MKQYTLTNAFIFFKKRQISCSKEFHCFLSGKKIHNERLPSLLDFLFLFLWQTQPFWMGESNTVGWIRWSRKLLHPTQLFLAQLGFINATGIRHLSKVFFATRQNENDKQFCARSQCVIFAKEHLNIFDWSGKDVIFHLYIKPALFYNKGYMVLS